MSLPLARIPFHTAFACRIPLARVPFNRALACRLARARPSFGGGFSRVRLRTGSSGLRRWCAACRGEKKARLTLCRCCQLLLLLRLRLLQLLLLLHLFLLLLLLVSSSSSTCSSRMSVARAGSSGDDANAARWPRCLAAEPGSLSLARVLLRLLLTSPWCRQWSPGGPGE